MEKDKNSSLLKHSLETGHNTIKVELEDTSILASNFGDYKKKRKMVKFPYWSILLFNHAN